MNTCILRNKLVRVIVPEKVSSTSYIYIYRERERERDRDRDRDRDTYRQTERDISFVSSAICQINTCILRNKSVRVIVPEKVSSISCK